MYIVISDQTDGTHIDEYSDVVGILVDYPQKEHEFATSAIFGDSFKPGEVMIIKGLVVVPKMQLVEG